LSRLSVTGGSFAERLMVVNIFLVAFNMLPAFPMDGGRVLRALLATRLEYTRATQIAAMIGQGMALLFGFLGLFTNPFLLFIALFVWIGAAQEASMTQMRSALGGIPVRRAMLTRFDSLSPSDTLDRAIELILAGSQHDFPVAEAGRVVGVLTRDRLFRALAQRELGWTVADVMERDEGAVEASEMLEAVLSRLQGSGRGIAPVVHAGRLVGLLTLDNVGEFLAIQSALERRRAAASPSSR
jgi:CBS domain-containing protein